MADRQTNPATVDVEALMQASGHSQQDAERIISALEEAGWMVTRMPLTQAERRKAARERKKQMVGFRL